MNGLSYHVYIGEEISNSSDQKIYFCMDTSQFPPSSFSGSVVKSEALNVAEDPKEDTESM